MVAEFIGFSDARPNYAALIEIPLRLREHATAQRAAVAEPQAALADIERRAMLELGIDAKEKVLAEARHKLAVVDDTVDKKQGVLRKLDETRKALVAGERQSGLQRSPGNHRRSRQQGRLGRPLCGGPPHAHDRR